MRTSRDPISDLDILPPNKVFENDFIQKTGGIRGGWLVFGEEILWKHTENETLFTFSSPSNLNQKFRYVPLLDTQKVCM